jgi:hypothetical protein
MTNVTQIANRSAIFSKPKSVSLSREELNSLKKYRKGFSTAIDCAMSLGVDRNVLGAVLLKGTGSPDSIEKIRAGLGKK